jgi:uncharacterized protein YbaR (Trm112 family)
VTDTTLAAASASPSPSSSLRAELLSLLISPDTGEPLTGWDGIAEEGVLVGTKTGVTYPVRGGIACLLPSALREAKDATAEKEDRSEVAEKRREMAARDAQVPITTTCWACEYLPAPNCLFRSVTLPRTPTILCWRAAAARDG